MFKTNLWISFDKYTVKSIDSVVCGIADEMASHILKMISMDMRKTMQISSNLNIVVNGRYEAAINLDVTDGLANGASGSQKSSVSRKFFACLWYSVDAV